MADNLRDSTKAGQNPTFAVEESKEQSVLGDKAVDGMDDDKDHKPNVISGLKGAINNENTSAKGKKEAEEKLKAIT